jgi:hypothetical protein
MAYGRKRWLERHCERSDITSHAVHLTRPVDGTDSATGAADVVLKILTERKLIGSTTKSGFIVGDRPAVCFQDAPLSSVVQNLWYEKKDRDLKPSAKVRYVGCGLVFDKNFLYAHGGRPVIYDATETAKAYLPKDQWWRIVNFNLSDQHSYIDWSHEREWRLPGNLEFSLRSVSVLLNHESSYRHFISKALETGQADILKEIRGILMLGPVLY